MPRFINSIVPEASAIPAVTGNGVTITSLVLSPGDWILSGEVWAEVTAGAPTVARVAATICSSPSVAPTDPAEDVAVNVQEPAQQKSVETQAGFVLPLAGAHVYTKVDVTYYLSGRIDWTGGGTILLYGKMFATRPDIPIALLS